MRSDVKTPASHVDVSRPRRRPGPIRRAESARVGVRVTAKILFSCDFLFKERQKCAEITVGEEGALLTFKLNDGN